MDFHHPIITQGAQETAAVGQKVALYLRGNQNAPHVLCLYGELGSGKTTFAQGFARGLGLSTRLLSPTFLIVRRYALAKNNTFFYHIDLYRLHAIDDMEELGLSEIFADPGAFAVIEWAEKLEDQGPQKRLDIWLSTREDRKHELVIKEI